MGANPGAGAAVGALFSLWRSRRPGSVRFRAVDADWASEAQKNRDAAQDRRDDHHRERHQDAHRILQRFLVLDERRIRKVVDAFGRRFVHALKNPFQDAASLARRS